MKDDEYEKLLASEQMAAVANNLEFMARMIGGFYTSLVAQGLPETIITPILVAFYQKMTVSSTTEAQKS
jgi:hypothetical protein